MEARIGKAIPEGKEWIYEPKWDGFRCLAFRDGDNIVLQSKSGQPLTRYFPELVDALLKLRAEQFVLDGEIVIEADGHLDFNALLQRIHPAESRIKKLSRETPVMIFCFDLLVDSKGNLLTDTPLEDRKKAIADFFKKAIQPSAAKEMIRLAPSSPSRDEADKWMTEMAAYGCDGIVAKLGDEPYHSGDRDAMVKVKRLRTSDCVIGGFRYATKKNAGVGSILLGLYNEARELDHVGFCSGFTAEQRIDLVKKLVPLIEKPGFTGKAPGGPSRWSAANPRSTEWEPLRPELVCEVQYDHFADGRFRHGTKFLRWRPDKAPKQCTFEQLQPAKPGKKAA
ncbi:MAG: dependent ligase [Acidobacteriales bacterium]|nr:dependent ligase [Terriglobales bacterium]